MLKQHRFRLWIIEAIDHHAVPKRIWIAESDGDMFSHVLVDNLLEATRFRSAKEALDYSKNSDWGCASYGCKFNIIPVDYEEKIEILP